MGQRAKMSSAAVLCAAFIFLGVLGACAQEADETVAWDRVDAQLIKKAKAQSAGRMSPEVYQNLGLSYFRQEMFDRAFLYFNAAVQADPRLYWSWYYLGLLNLEAAESYFRKAIEVNKRFAPAYYWLGRYYMKKDKASEAIKIFEAYLRVAPASPNEEERIPEVQRLLESLGSV